MAFRVSTAQQAGREVFRLHDDASGASAAIMPSFGFNLFDLRLPAGGEVRQVIGVRGEWTPNPEHAARSGIPILFPYPNRVALGTFSFNGKAWELPINSGKHAIHGFALDAPWDVIDHGSDGTAATITGRFQLSKNAPEKRPHWPTDAVLQVKYSLAGQALTMTVTVSNPTADPLPYGFGIHPYFHLPFGPGKDLAKTRVIVPASEYWVLDGFIPTGQRKPVDRRLDFRDGQPMAGLKLDDVLTGLQFQGDRCTARLVDQELGAEFRLSFDRNIRELVLYTPPADPDVISLEPYTQTTDAVNLAANGIDGGLRMLPHGGADTFQIRMETVG